MGWLLFPGQRPHRRRQQPQLRGDLFVVGGKVHLQLHPGAAARRSHRDGVPQQEDQPVVALGVGAAAGVIRGPLAKAHPAGPGVSGVDPAPHLHHGVVGGVGVPADVQVAEGGHRKLRGGVAAVGQVAARRAVQHHAAVFQRYIIQLAPGEGLGALQDQIVPLFHGTVPPFPVSVKNQICALTGGVLLRSARRQAPPPAGRPSACGCSPRCGRRGRCRRRRSGSRPPPGTRSRTPA